MASAKYFIGVIYTNVTWWALSQDLSTFEILVTPGIEQREGIEFWISLMEAIQNKTTLIEDLRTSI